MMKKISSLLVAVALVLSMSAMAFGANKVKTIENGVFVASLGYTSGEKFDVGGTLSNVYEDFKAGDAINIYLDPSKITMDGDAFTPATGMSARDLENAGVTFRTTGGQNSNLIQNVSFKEKELNGKKVALLQVKLVDRYVATEDKDFDTTITLYANKTKQQSITIGGTLTAPTLDVSEGDTYIYLGDGEIAKATEAVTGVEVDTGNSLSIFSRMHKGKKYYAVSRIEPTDYDLTVMNDHPEIEMVYQLDTQGFMTDAQVKIKSSDKLYIYDGNGKALGTTDDKVALSGKYYLSSKEIDMNLSGDPQGGNNVIDGGSDTDGDIDEPTLPGGDVSIPNPGEGNGGTNNSGSDIPDTGIGVGPKIAAFAVVASLATIGVVTISSKKKK